MDPLSFQIDGELFSSLIDKAFDDIMTKEDDFAVPVNKAPKQKHNGMNCSKCKEFNSYIEEGNQEDGTFICHGCNVKW